MMNDAPKPKMVRVTVSLPIHILEKLDESAAKNRRSRSNALALMIEKLA